MGLDCFQHEIILIPTRLFFFFWRGEVNFAPLQWPDAIMVITHSMFSDILISYQKKKKKIKFMSYVCHLTSMFSLALKKNSWH